jgi:DNA-binding response OmpR family regulator
MFDSSPPGKCTSNSMPSHAVRVLFIVNDAELVSGSISAWTAGNGFDVKCACDIAEAIHLLNTYHFDLMLTEFQMPAMSIFALFSWMRKHPSSMLLCMSIPKFRKEGFWPEIKPYLDDLLTKRCSIRGPVDRIKKTDNGQGHAGAQ